MTNALGICVVSRSTKPGVAGWRARSDGREGLVVRVAQAPANGEANAAVIKLLARALGVSRSELAIVAGQAARHKRLAIPFDIEEARRRLGV